MIEIIQTDKKSRRYWRKLKNSEFAFKKRIKYAIVEIFPSQKKQQIIGFGGAFTESASFSYIAASEGVYDLYIRYATDLNCVAYIRANQGPWVSVNLMSTSWWDTPRVAVVSVNMQAGSQTIVLTGTTNDGGWMNYDFIDIIQQGTLTDEEVAINYATFFREQTSAGCTAQNDNLIPWAQLQSEYLTLSASTKDAFVVSTNELALDAKARYQVLINKYSSLASDNWLVDGDGDPVYSSAIISSDLQVNTNAGLLLGVSMIIISTIGLAVILFRKRKYNF